MVDARIKDGDLAADSAGNVDIVSGADALFQRALICITVPLGSFVYNRELGSRHTAADAERIELVLSEALADYPETTVRVLSVTDESVRLELIINGESRVEEVRLFGDV